MTHPGKAGDGVADTKTSVQTEQAPSSRVRANRKNAQRSTGPRTAKGKRRTAQNAKKHGLSLPISADPQVEPMIERLARHIAGQVSGKGYRVAPSNVSPSERRRSPGLASGPDPQASPGIDSGRQQHGIGQVVATEEGSSLVRQGQDLELERAARDFVEAQLDLIRIRHIRHGYLESLSTTPSAAPNSVEARDQTENVSSAEDDRIFAGTNVPEALALPRSPQSEGMKRSEVGKIFSAQEAYNKTLKQVASLVRYERRALSRRKKAARALDRMRQLKSS